MYPKFFAMMNGHFVTLWTTLRKLAIW